jgi:hypothetical protein
MDAICSSETFDDFHHTIQRYEPEVTIVTTTNQEENIGMGKKLGGIVTRVTIYQFNWILRILKMVYNTQNYRGFRIFPHSSILGTRKHNVSKSESVSVHR